MSALTPILARTPVTAITDVLARMEEIGAALPPTDGVACFNQLYMEVTRAVIASAPAGGFANQAFLSELDVAFGNLYFAALSALDAGAPVPPAWSPLFEVRGSNEIAPIQFALAGMNAHINRDLPVGLVRAFAKLGLEMDDPSPEYSDFEHVNDVLAATESRMRDEYFTGLLAQLNKSFPGAEDVIAMWSVRKARNVAWENGELLWKLKAHPTLQDDYVGVLDRSFSFAGRLLLQPTI
jgi:hypothetical protein